MDAVLDLNTINHLSILFLVCPKGRTIRILIVNDHKSLRYSAVSRIRHFFIDLEIRFSSKTAARF